MQPRGVRKQAVKGGVCVTHGATKKVAATRGVPVEPSGEAFASRMARLRIYAARTGVPTEPREEAFASRTARG